MNFIDAIKSFFNNYFNFKGRASRSEFWYAILFCFMISRIALFADAILAQTSEFYKDGMPKQGLIYTIQNIGTLIPYWAIFFRRLHDLNKSALKILVIPFISFWIIIGIFFLIGAFDYAGGIIGILLVILSVIYFIYLIVLLCLPGKSENNKYGPNPLFIDKPIDSNPNNENNNLIEEKTIWDENK